MLRTSVPREPILDSARQGLDVRISDIDISTEHSFLILFSPDLPVFLYQLLPVLTLFIQENFLYVQRSKMSTVF